MRYKPKMDMEAELLKRIPGLPAIRRIETLSGTKSGGENYRLYPYLGSSYLLKVYSDRSPEQTKKDLAENRIWLRAFLPVQRILRTGRTADGDTYTLSRWISGKTLDTVFPCGSYAEERELGILSGNLLKKVHDSLPARTELTVQENLRKRLEHLVSRIGDTAGNEENSPVISAVNRLREEMGLAGDGQCLRLHGDYHAGNLVLDNRDRLHILDPVYGSSGAAEEDMARVLVSAEYSSAFARGQIESYYVGNIPEWFWGRLRYYALLHLAEAWSFGEGNGSSGIYKDLLMIIQKQYPQLLSKDDMIFTNETPLFWRDEYEQHRR